MTDKREQVFVSSTYLDLVEERQGVIQVLLQANCIPAGMELFPSSNDDRWRLIQRVINGCDYYVLIIGGRYGSVDPDSNLSYTEMEYDYAVAEGKPVMALLHGNAGKLERDRTDVDADKWIQLLAFREKVQAAHVVQYWTSAEELPGKVAISLLAARENSPAVGWVRGDAAMTPETKAELAELRAKLAETQQELEHVKSDSIPKMENLAGGDDPYTFTTRLVYVEEGGNAWDAKAALYNLTHTWNELFRIVAPSLINEANESELRKVLDEAFIPRYPTHTMPKDYGRFVESKIRTENFEDILVQLFALGLIRRGVRRRTTSDTKKYWALTDAGSDQLMLLRAIRKDATS